MTDKLEVAEKEWHPPTELAGDVTPRRVRLTELGRAAVLVALCFLAGGFAVLYFYLVGPLVADLRLDRRLGVEGVAASAQIVRKWHRPEDSLELVGLFEGVWMVEYSFEAEGRAYTRDAQVSHDVYSRLKRGRRIPVRYLRSDPSISRMAFELPFDTEDALGAILGFAVCLGFVLIILIPLLRSRNLLRTGRPACAMVTKIEWKRLWYQSSMLAKNSRIHYEFRDSAGHLVQRKTGTGTGVVGAGPGPRTAVFSPRNPRRNLLYPSVAMAVEGIDAGVTADLKQLSQEWRAPSELAGGPGSRPGRITGSGKLYIGLGVFFIALSAAGALGPMFDPPMAGDPIVLWGLGAFAALGVSFGALLIQIPRRSRELLRSGRPTPGIVTQIVSKYRAQYAFLDSAGNLRKGSTFFEGFKVVSGTRTVLYDPEHPRRNLLYPVDVAKLETEKVEMPPAHPANALLREWTCSCGTKLRAEFKRAVDRAGDLEEIACPKCEVTHAAVPKGLDEDDWTLSYKEDGKWIQVPP